MSEKKSNAGKNQDKGSVLTYKRSVEYGEATLRAYDSQGNKHAIAIDVHGQRPTKAFEGAQDASNLIVGERTVLPDLGPNVQTSIEGLWMRFPVRFRPIEVAPDTVTDPEVDQQMRKIVESLLTDNDIMCDVASYYAYNILSAAPAWRNREVAERIDVTVKARNSGRVIASLSDVGEQMPRFPLDPELLDPNDENHPLHQHWEKIESLSALIHEAFTGNEPGTGNSGNGETVIVEYWMEMMPGQQVFPSQKFNPGETPKIGKTPLGTQLHRVSGSGEPGITSQKIGAAVRCFDIWHDHPELEVVNGTEPNGGSLRFQSVLRGSRSNFFALRRHAAQNLSQDKPALEGISPGNRRFMTGVLIRGGLFGDPNPKKQ